MIYKVINRIIFWMKDNYLEKYRGVPTGLNSDLLAGGFFMQYRTAIPVLHKYEQAELSSANLTFVSFT